MPEVDVAFADLPARADEVTEDEIRTEDLVVFVHRDAEPPSPDHLLPIHRIDGPHAHPLKGGEPVKVEKSPFRVFRLR